MAGIYLHIPFCKKRCLYCDFYSNVEMNNKERYVISLCSELIQRKDYIKGEKIKTIYFGGGTPTQLNINDFEVIFSTINQVFDLSECDEITLEANPDDLIEEYIRQLALLPFNRISIGIQSFNDHDLKFLNRRHNASQAVDAIKTSQKFGFKNISIDLIYGLPGQTIEAWKKNLQIAMSLDIQHVSAYHLIYEESTQITKLLNAGKIIEVDEDTSLEMFKELIKTLKHEGFLHYEISNFGKEGYLSKHNTSYWKDEIYLGIGAAAHSFNGEQRTANIANIKRYMDGVDNHKPEISQESLDLNTRYNDYIITSLRTMWGISLRKLEQSFGTKLNTYCLDQSKPHLFNHLLEIKNNHLMLTDEGIFVSDGIMSDLLYVD